MLISFKQPTLFKCTSESSIPKTLLHKNLARTIKDLFKHHLTDHTMSEALKGNLDKLSCRIHANNFQIHWELWILVGSTPLYPCSLQKIEQFPLVVDCSPSIPETHSWTWLAFLFHLLPMLAKPLGIVESCHGQGKLSELVPVFCGCTYSLVTHSKIKPRVRDVSCLGRGKDHSVSC